MPKFGRWTKVGIWCLGGLGLLGAGCKPATTAPRPVKAGWFVDADRYRSSVHGRVSCDKCHADVNQTARPAEESETPPRTHAKQLPGPGWRPSFEGCRSCHPYEYAEFQSGPHGAALTEPAPGLPDCATCHSAHYGRPLADRAQAVALQLQQCSSCHQKDLRKGQHLTPGHRPQDGLSCGTCHGVHAAEKLTASPQDQPACQGCHAHLQKGARHAAK